ncbi:uncharacterized protein EI97DRAFT_493199 [Westerdykella ornata]|uniref:Peptidase M48 domain-containing protein n=1 Tax=Westerdykella ornata TaxID=318751 RepID=A0A6A6JP22_WESOR|nr:uncharacterized protein EI97DRAFT_493199 [Westerdykella ornata]KAF2277995.1 hypothetical protein EI97DRAFT_493199 [Westerdykella ornata]
MFRWRPLQTPLQAFDRSFQWQPRILHRTVQHRWYRFGGPHRGPQYRYFRQHAGQRITNWIQGPTFFRDATLISLGAGGIYLWNLEEVPISGRRRFNIISPGFEAYIAQKTMKEIMQEYRGRFLPEWDPRVQQVRRVLYRLLPYVRDAGGLQDVDWEVHVIDSPEMNAFVIPGGKVFFFTGILPMCRTEDGIAAVMAHEIAHVVAHHTAEKLSRAPFILMGVLLLYMVDVSFTMGTALMNLFLEYPGSRKQEEEADFIGLLMMAEGCYRPEAAAELWARMDRLEAARGERTPEILTTHPSHGRREAKIREWLPKAYEKREHSDCGNIMGFVRRRKRLLHHLQLRLVFLL